MCRKVFDHVALYVPADDAHVLFAVDFHVEQGRKKTARFQALQQLVVRKIDRKRISAATIYDARYEPVSASLTSGPLACPRPYRGVKIRDLTSHGYSPNCKRF